MAETPISSLTALAVAPASGDLFAIVDVSDATQAPTGTTKKIATSVLFTSPTFTTSVTVTGTLSVSGLATLTAGATAGAAITLTGAAGAGASNYVSSDGAAGARLNANTGHVVTIGVSNADSLVIATASVTVGLTLITVLSATGAAGFRLPHGAAPTSPVDGDTWSTTAGLFIRINGVTKTVTLT